jgi:hypothetical protein
MAIIVPRDSEEQEQVPLTFRDEKRPLRTWLGRAERA